MPVRRPQAELDFLMALLEQYLIEERAEIREQNIRFSTIGRREGLPDAVLREIDENIRQTQDNTGMGLSLAINYGGRTELIDAVRQLSQYSALAMNVIGRGVTRARKMESMNDRWLAASTIGPRSGTWASPFTSTW